MHQLATVAALGLAVALGLGGEALERRQAPRLRRFTVEASATGFRPAVLRVAAGDTVWLDLVATDVVHGLWIEGYPAEITAEPGRPGRARFVARRPGSFRLRCSIPCGPLHPFVGGWLKVGHWWTLWRRLALGLGVVLAAGLWARRANRSWHAGS